MLKQQALYFEDIEAGRVFESGTYAVTADEIKTFARQYDPQPYHLDEEAAKSTFFGGLAASGWHTAAMSMRLLVDSIPVAGGLVGAGLENLKWNQPVRPGDTLHVRTEVLSARISKTKPDIGLVKARHTTFNQHNEAVQDCTSTIVVPLRTEFAK